MYDLMVLLQEEYQREGIQWKNIEFIDNTACLELFSKRPSGLFCLLDEECKYVSRIHAFDTIKVLVFIKCLIYSIHFPCPFSFFLCLCFCFQCSGQHTPHLPMNDLLNQKMKMPIMKFSSSAIESAILVCALFPAQLSRGNQ